MVPENQKENAEFVKENLAPMLNDIYIEEEDEIFSLKALKKTLKRIRFKLQGRKGDEDKVARAAKEIDKFSKRIESLPSDLVTARLEKFSEELFVDYRTLMEELHQNADPQFVEILSLPKNHT